MRLTTRTAAPARAGIPARMSTWIGRGQRSLADRVHAAGDDCARRYGWEVTKSTGRFGFGARSYRDPRFDDRRLQLSRRAVQDFQHDRFEHGTEASAER
jgi:hypothetical protein